MKVNPEKIILFGSYAWGEPTEESDIDLLVVTSDEKVPVSFAEKSQIYLLVSRTISKIKRDFPVDLVVHTKGMHRKFIDEDSFFARELTKNGKVLYEKIN